jgi:putative hemolysin
MTIEVQSTGVRSTPHPARLVVSPAHQPADIDDALRLRYKVFAEEMGAHAASADGLERDEFDGWCDHLIVRDRATLRVVVTYRMLPPHRARRLGRLYAEREFDLTRFDHLRSSTLEVGRSCVHRDYRHGGTILLLWAGLAHYMKAGASCGWGSTSSRRAAPVTSTCWRGRPARRSWHETRTHPLEAASAPRLARRDARHALAGAAF